MPPRQSKQEQVKNVSVLSANTEIDTKSFVSKEDSKVSGVAVKSNGIDKYYSLKDYGDVPSNLSMEDHTIDMVDGNTEVSITVKELVKDIQPKSKLPVTLVSATEVMSTYVWKGILVRDLLLQKDMVDTKKTRMISRKSVEFVGNDDSTCCIPLARILNPAYDIILAYETNGALLKYDDGAPVRLIVPGCTATYSIKWIKKINITCNDEDKVTKLNQSGSELSINSSITRPAHNESIDIAKMYKGTYDIEGIAYAGGGRKITRVEISTDKGITWKLAEIHRKEQPNDYENYWCSVGWSYKNAIPVIQMITIKEIWARSWDESNNVQRHDYKVKIHLVNNSVVTALDHITSTSVMKKYALKFEHLPVGYENVKSDCSDDHEFLP